MLLRCVMMMMFTFSAHLDAYRMEGAETRSGRVCTFHALRLFCQCFIRVTTLTTPNSIIDRLSMRCTIRHKLSLLQPSSISRSFPTILILSLSHKHHGNGVQPTRAAYARNRSRASD